MKTPKPSLILGAVIIGLGAYASLSFYEKKKIQEIQQAGPQDQIVPPGKATLFLVNNKIWVGLGLSVVLLALASYSSKSPSSPRMAPVSVPVEPPAEI